MSPASAVHPRPRPPRPPSLPDPPSLELWRPAHWSTLLALMDAVYPSISVEGNDSDPSTAENFRVTASQLNQAYESLVRLMGVHAPSRPDFDAYLADRPSLSPAFTLSLRRTVDGLGPGRKPLDVLLRLLSTRTGTLLLTGHWSVFSRLPLQTRERTLRAWQTSRLAGIRLAARTIPSMATWAHLQTSHLFLRLSGYPDGPDGRAYDTASAAGHDQDGAPDAFLPFPPPPRLQSQTSPADQDNTAVELDADVVVVGSGCGGAVCAKMLAEAGRRVVVLDKGFHFGRAHFPMTQQAGAHHLFDRHGYLLSDDLSISLVAGSCWGGGGTVNWGVCLSTPDRVRRHWAARLADPFFASAAYQACLDRVATVAGASAAGLRHNRRNAVLVDGCAHLGMRCSPAPLNSAGAAHHCGRCQLGCPSAYKRGPAVVWLAAAAHAGACFVEGVRVSRVLFAPLSAGTHRRRAIGVEGVWTSRPDAAHPARTRPIVVKAKQVILACGALWSPIVLLNSGLKNSHIGAHLHLHPCCFVGAFYDQDMEPWEGCSITAYSAHLADLDEAGYGVVLEPTCMVPYSILSSLPWLGGLEHKLAMLKYRHFTAFLALTRDHTAGRVYPDRATGQPRVAYTPSGRDRAHALRGAAALARICRATGAVELRAFFARAPPLRLPAADAAMAAWLRALRPADGVWASAHQMGSCRMAAHAGAGVVDPCGRVWDVDGLAIADASVLPGPPGVNPMLTVMAVADHIARAVLHDLS